MAQGRIGKFKPMTEEQEIARLRRTAFSVSKFSSKSQMYRDRKRLNKLLALANG